ncbi:MAG: GNAT family N-acetyltransferase [Oscillospiraceae bacterium]|jgi:hypothetical protein|nr:GNAT family N-acetyltransferase [Oscillospiraceae bacterium]
MTNEQILEIALAQQAIDSSCVPADFRRHTPVVVVSQKLPGARRYLQQLPFFCDLVSYGSNIVASVDARIAGFITEFIGSRKPHECFEPQEIRLLNREFAPYGATVRHAAEYYWLPDVNCLCALPCAYETRLLTPPDFVPLYRPEWGNALCADRAELDVLGVGAYDGGQLIGLAACSADGENMWQIGIDVLPEYRRQSVAAALTSCLAIEIITREKVPFYCCNWANIGSARNAIRSGFRPAWAALAALMDAEEVQN